MEFVTWRLHSKEKQTVIEIVNPHITRGRIRLSHRELQAYYETTPFALIRARSACELKGQFPVGEVTLKPEAYQPLLDALAGGPKTLPELLRQPPLAQQNFASLIESLHVLGALGYAQAGRPLGCKARNAAASRAFNQAVLQRALMGQELSTLASPVLGCGVTLGLTDQLFLCGYQRQPKDPIAFVWQQLKALGRRLLRDSQTLDGEADSLQRLRELHETFVADTLPLCRQLALL